MTDVARYASRVLVMCDARVVMDGTVPEVFSRAPELKAMGLAVPQITDIFIRLREKGYDVDTAVFTSEQAAKQLRRLRGGGKMLRISRSASTSRANRSAQTRPAHETGARRPADRQHLRRANAHGLPGRRPADRARRRGFGHPARLILKSLKPLIFIIVLTTIINIFYGTPGEVLAQWWIFRITAEGIYRAVVMAVRIVLLVVGTSC